MPNKKDIAISTSKKGMNKDSHISALQQGEYTHAKNSNFEDENGNSYNIQNEHSNLLANKFKNNYRVVGVKNDPFSNKVYYFLVNPITNVSEIGYIENKSILPDLGDTITSCGDCEYKVDLSAPLEEQEQQETQVYTTLLNDSCNYCLAFHINYPIKSIEIKNEKCGRVMYFTDNLNPPRYIELDNIDKYKYTGEELCGDESFVEDTCVACEKMLIFKKSTIPNLEPEKIVVGGNLKRGTYEFLIAYSDELGNEIGRYFSITNPISIFDENNNILQQEETDDETNFAIKLKVSNLDLDYTHYKVAVIQRTDVSSSTSYFIEGVHSTSDNEIIYTTDQDKERTTLLDLSVPAVRVDKWKSLTSSYGYLLGSGITRPKQMNLQPVVNLMGVFLNWQSYIAKEDLYKDGVAAANYKGYYRDETYPLGIRFLLDGEYSPTYHFIGRPPTTEDLEVIDNKDSKSMGKLSSSCMGSEIDKRWQIYNTAEEFGTCELSENIPTNIVTEEVKNICYIPALSEHTNGSFSISLDEGEFYVNLETWIDTNKDFLNEIANDPNCVAENGQELCDLATFLNPDTYSTQHCTPDFDEVCTVDTNPVEEEIEVSEIVGESATKIEKIYPEEYSILPPPSYCNLHEMSFTSGGKQDDFYFRHGWMIGDERRPDDSCAGAGGIEYWTGVTYRRNYSAVNEACSYAKDIPKYNPLTGNNIGIFHNYYGSDIDTDEGTDIEKIETLQTNKSSLPLSIPTEPTLDGNMTNGEFTDKIHKGALWFKHNFANTRKSILNITPQSVPADQDQISEAFLLANDPINTKVRLTLFDSCGDTTPLFADLIDMSQGKMYYVRIEDDNTFSLIEDDGTTHNYPQLNSDDFYIALDVPIINTRGMKDPSLDVEEMWCQEMVERFRTMPTQGCFSVMMSDIQYDRVEVDFDKIVIQKKETYIASCDYEVPVLQDCEAYPYKFGSFGYTESTEEYPDNDDLYDSSRLKITTEDLPTYDYFDGESFKDYFEDNYVQSVDPQGNYNWATDSEERPITDFRCRQIRHFKFPDNITSPFMYQNNMAGFSESIIYPLGITINEDIINSFLEIALKNGLITQQQRDKIQGYEIVRGDRTANESISAKGIVFDMMSYKENEKDVLYANYPFNDLGADRLNFANDSRSEFVPHPYNSLKNYNWTFTSPETEKDELTLPSFMKVDGYMFGATRGQFDAVRDHPEWVILGSKLRGLASTLATIEIVSEIVIKAAEMTSRQFFIVGMAGGTSLGLVSAAIVAAFESLSASMFKYARYKYEWLQSFRDLGEPRNFAYYYTAIGHMNYFKPNIHEGDQTRYLNVAKNINKGRLIITDNVGGKQLNLNHIDREKTVFLSTGNETQDLQNGEDNSINYDIEYINYDNSDKNFNYASRTFAEENNACSKGLSSEVIRKAASMYVSLKNHLPSQYGTIGSVKWLTTGYRGDLSQPKTSCIGIFGGDVFISRTSTLRRFPFFYTTAMGTPSLTSFAYKDLANIGGEPRFYCDYAINTEDLSAGRPLPDVNSVYNFDCFSGNRGNYVTEPSKFYLYYNGIPTYLTESTINTWYRHAKPEPWNNFYPNVGDHMEWTQEVVNSIRRDNKFFYNNTYSKNVTQTATFTLPSNYDKKEYDCKTDMPNGTMFSLPDNSENAYVDPWLIYKPYDFYEFKTEWGNLIELRGVETSQIMGRFSNTLAIFNAIDTLVDDGSNPASQVMGDGFQRRPRTFTSTDLGYMGTQTQDMVSCEYGHFFVDADRGQVFKINTGGQGFEEISSYVNGEPSGMEKWFKKHLPFKIKEHFPDIDIDNPYNNIGITMGWDSLYKRVFITKKDYIPDDCIEYLEENCTTTTSCPEGYTYNEETGMCETDDCEGNGLDMVFVIDVTTSQQNAIDNIKNNISTTIIPAILAKFGTNYRLGLVSVLDTRIDGSPLYEIITPMSVNNSTQFVTDLNALVLGGDQNANWPEPTDLALDAVLNNKQEYDHQGNVLPSDTIGIFRSAASKAIVLTTDAMPSGIDDAYDYSDWLNANAMADLAATRDIKIFPISTTIVAEPPVEEPQPGVTVPPSSNVQIYLTYIMQNYANKTNGQYYYAQDGNNISDSIVDAIENNVGCNIFPVEVENCTEAGFYLKEECGGSEITCPDGYTYNEETGLCDPTTECEKPLDIVFILDATGSQQNAINSIKNSISTIIIPEIITKYGEDYRIGLVAVKDRREPGQSLFDLITPMQIANEIWVVSGLNSITAGGGSGGPEPTDMALEAVLNNTQEIDLNGDIVKPGTLGSFRTNAAKAIVLVTDNLPSGLGDDYNIDDWLHADILSDQANNDSVQIFSILTSATEPAEVITPLPNVTHVMKNYANKTNGQYYFKASGIGIDEDVVNAIQDKISCGDPVYPTKQTIDVSNEEYFKDVSWTISFNVKSGSWGSFFDFKPNYYVAHNDYFQTGINTTPDPSEFGVWSHLLTNKSYNVFYGKAYDWEIEIPVPNKGASKYMETFSYDLDVRRYHNDYDYAENKYLGFEEAMIWNNSNNSGKLKLDLQRTLNQLSKYPKTQGDTQTILQASQDGTFTFNYFYNRVKNDGAGLPLFTWDENQIEKKLNAQAISFFNKRILERIRGNTFLVNLKTSETQHKKIFKIAKTKENLYDR